MGTAPRTGLVGLLVFVVTSSVSGGDGRGGSVASSSQRIAPERISADAPYFEALSRIFDAPRSGADLTGGCLTSTALDRYNEGLYRIKLAMSGRDAGVGAAELDAGGVRLRDGIWIVDSDDTMLYHDDPADLEGTSLRFTPNGGGYDVSVEPIQYDTDLGLHGIVDAPSRIYAIVTLSNFNFPIGGSAYGQLFVGTDLAVRTQTPAGAGIFEWDQYSVPAAGADLFQDRVDRLSPLFYARSSNQGRNIFFRDTPEKLLITWMTSLDPASETFHVDVQAALYPDGSILYSYRSLKNVDNGSPQVFAGIQAWIDGFQQKASVSDPVDAGLAAADVVQVTVDEDPASDLIHVRATMAGDIPSSSADRIFYKLSLSQGGERKYFLFTYVDSQGVNSLWNVPESVGGVVREGPTTIDGPSWDVLFSLSELPDLTTGPVEVEVATEQLETELDSVTVTPSISGGPTLARDYTAEAPFSSSRPIFESFLFPWFIPVAAKDKLFAHTGWDETLVDGVPMYQSFFTDLNLWVPGGAYYTYGNCAAANMGQCDPSIPIRPGLLNMNRPNAANWNFQGNPSRFTVLSHELGHHWLQKIDIDEGSGPTDVLNPESTHPAAYVYAEALADLVFFEDASVMGGAFWVDNGDGTFSTQPAYTFYSYAGFELYLMGMMAPSEVPDWYYIANANPPQPNSYWPQPNTTVTGTRRDVSIDMVIDAMGERSPAYPDERRDLFVPMVLVVRPGEEPSEDDWDFMMDVRDPWRDAFRIQTFQRGSVTTVSTKEVSAADDAPLRIEKVGGDLRLRFEDPGFADQVRYNVYEGVLDGTFDDWAPDLCGATPTAAGSEQYLDLTPPAGVSTYYLVTMSSVAFEGTAGEDSSDQERSTSATPCGPLGQSEPL